MYHLAETQTPSRQPLTGERHHTDGEEPEPVSSRAAPRGSRSSPVTRCQRDRPREKLIGVLLHRHGTGAATRQNVAILSGRQPNVRTTSAAETKRVRVLFRPPHPANGLRSGWT